MEHRSDPIWQVLAHQGRRMAWLAERTGYSEAHLKALKGGRHATTPGFRRLAAKALDVPEFVLFRPTERDESTAAAS